MFNVHLELDKGPVPGRAISLDLQAWKPLLRLTSSFKVTCIKVHSDRVSFPCTYRPYIRSLQTLNHLVLANVRFQSLSSLLGLIGCLRKLKGIYFEKVIWGPSDDFDFDSARLELPRCRAPFTTVELVSWKNCCDSREAVWIHAGKSLRHEYTLRRAEDDQVPPDLLGIVQLINLLYDDPEEQLTGLFEVRQVHDSDHAYAFSVRLSESSALHSSATIITRPTPVQNPALDHNDSKSTLNHRPSLYLGQLVIVWVDSHHPPTSKEVFGVDHFLRDVDNVLASFEHLNSVDLFYRADAVDIEHLERAEEMFVRRMPRTGEKVRLEAYGNGDDKRDLHKFEVNVGDFHFRPFEDWLRADWVAEL